MSSGHFPRKGDRLFQLGCGRPNTIIWNDRHDRRSQLLRGYRTAAELVAERALQQSDHSDLMVFPVVYLYRHVFEFAMKAVIETGGLSAGVGPDYKRHRLTPLWHDCFKVLQHWSLTEIGVEHRVRGLLQEFDRVDAGSYSFRYHTDTEGNVSNAVPLAFDLVGFVQTADRMASYFDYIVSEISYRVGYCLEAQDDAVHD